MRRIKHEPVLVKQVKSFLNIKKGKKFIDATLGLGGHAELICRDGGKVLGIDWDKEAIAIARQRLTLACPDAVLVWANFTTIEKVAHEFGFFPADGVLFDLGVSGLQLEMPGRGFSFLRDELLDMRMDPQHQAVTAKDLINLLSARQLYDLFTQTTQKNLARAVSRAVVSARRAKLIETTGELVRIVESVSRFRRRRHPATTIFLALRMAVNSELENLKEGLVQALSVLGKGGRIGVISFHSGEDRIVKNFLRTKAAESEIKILTKKPIRPNEDEIWQNPRSRSAKFRVAEKL